jgi:hypothetical protein
MICRLIYLCGYRPFDFCPYEQGWLELETENPHELAFASVVETVAWLLPRPACCMFIAFVPPETELACGLVEARNK